MILIKDNKYYLATQSMTVGVYNIEWCLTDMEQIKGVVFDSTEVDVVSLFNDIVDSHKYKNKSAKNHDTRATKFY